MTSYGTHWIALTQNLVCPNFLEVLKYLRDLDYETRDFPVAFLPSLFDPPTFHLLLVSSARMFGLGCLNFLTATTSLSYSLSSGYLRDVTRYTHFSFAVLLRSRLWNAISANNPVSPFTPSAYKTLNSSPRFLSSRRHRPFTILKRKKHLVLLFNEI